MNIRLQIQLVLSLFCLPLLGDPFVEGHIIGQLGNQMFIVAAATSLAIDNGVVPLFPDFVKKTSEGIPYNYERIFFRVQTSPDTTNREYLYHEPFFHYKKIPYHR